MQKRNPRPLFSAAVLAVAGAMACTPCLRAAEKLVLYGGHAKEATRFQFDNGKFVAPDQAAIDRQDVKEWWISGKQENAQAAAAVSVQASSTIQARASSASISDSDAPSKTGVKAR